MSATEFAVFDTVCFDKLMIFALTQIIRPQNTLLRGANIRLDANESERDGWQKEKYTRFSHSHLRPILC